MISGRPTRGYWKSTSVRRVVTQMMTNWCSLLCSAPSQVQTWMLCMCCSCEGRCVITELRFNGAPYFHTSRIFNKKKTERYQHICAAAGIRLPLIINDMETEWWTGNLYMFLTSAQLGLVSRVTQMMSANSVNNNTGWEFSDFYVAAQATRCNASAPAQVRRQAEPQCWRSLAS